MDLDGVERTRERVRELHGQAYRWDPPLLHSGRRETSARMREYVRRWITEWDLNRLDPQAAVWVISDSLAMDYETRQDLEGADQHEGSGDQPA